MINPFILANKQGIPRIESVNVSVQADKVEFNFNPHNFYNNNFSGLILVKLNQTIPAGTTATLPIAFSSSTSPSQFLKNKAGENITVAEIESTGIYLVYFERSSNTLQLMI